MNVDLSSSTSMISKNTYSQLIDDTKVGSYKKIFNDVTETILKDVLENTAKLVDDIPTLADTTSTIHTDSTSSKSSDEQIKGVCSSDTEYHCWKCNTVNYPTIPGLYKSELPLQLSLDSDEKELPIVVVHEFGDFTIKTRKFQLIVSRYRMSQFEYFKTFFLTYPDNNLIEINDDNITPDNISVLLRTSSIRQTTNIRSLCILAENWRVSKKRISNILKNYVEIYGTFIDKNSDHVSEEDNYQLSPRRCTIKMNNTKLVYESFVDMQYTRLKQLTEITMFYGTIRDKDNEKFLCEKLSEYFIALKHDIDKYTTPYKEYYTKNIIDRLITEDSNIKNYFNKVILLALMKGDHIQIPNKN